MCILPVYLGAPYIFLMKYSYLSKKKKKKKKKNSKVFLIGTCWRSTGLNLVLIEGANLYEFQEDFYAVVDWAYKIDPLRCISMHGITERYLSGQKADAAGFVRLLLGDLESRISMQFSRVSFNFNQK